MTAEVLIVKQWRRYGKNHLYVSHPDGSKLGYWDLAWDEGHPLEPGLMSILEEAVALWRQEQPEPTAVIDTAVVPLVEVAIESEALAPASESPTIAAAESFLDTETIEWYDLAQNKPGQAVRNQAKAARDDQGAVLTVIARAFDIKTAERAWRVGADGEERVGWVLDKLQRKDPRWRFLHSVPVGKNNSDIDHVLLGPAGIFTVNTKRHPEATVWAAGMALTVNGNHQPYLRNSKFEYERTARLLTAQCGFPVRAQALIVIDGAKKLAFGRKDLPENIHVLSRDELYAWLRKQPEVMTAAGIEAVYDQARRSTTWQT